MNQPIDLRGLPVWERPAPVLEAFERLPVGGTLTFITENEPRGLGARLEQSLPDQTRIEPRRISGGHWQVDVTRVERDSLPVTILGALQRVAVLSSLPAPALKRLASRARAGVLRKGERDATDASNEAFLGVVWEGVAAVTSRQHDKRARRFFDVFPYEIFGEIGLLDGGSTIGCVIALSKSVRYIAIPRATVLAACVKHPELTMALAATCAQHARFLAEALTAQGTQPIVARIAAALLPYAVAERGMARAAAPLPNMTQSQLAASAGTVKEVAARAVAALEERGALRRERGHIRFLDRSLLLEISRSL